MDYTDAPFGYYSWNQYHVAAAVANLVCAIPCLILYMMIVFVILLNPKSFANKPFYTLLLSLAVSDIFQTLTIIFYLCPCIFYQSLILGYNFDWILGVLELFAYYAGMSMIVVITFNRYIAVCRFASYKRLFRPNLTRLYIAGAWLFGVFCGMWGMFPGFIYTYINGYYAPRSDTHLYLYYFWADRILTVAVFCIVVLCYVAILLQVKRSGSVASGGNNQVDQNEKKHQEKIERNLALQFGIIVVIFTCYEILTNFQYLALDQLLFYMLISLSFVAFVGVNPFVYLAFNGELRACFSQMFCKCHSRVAVSNISGTVSNSDAVKKSNRFVQTATLSTLSSATNETMF